MAGGGAAAGAVAGSAGKSAGKSSGFDIGAVIGIIGSLAGSFINGIYSNKLAKEAGKTQLNLANLSAEQQKEVLKLQAAADGEHSRYAIAMQALLADKYAKEKSIEAAPMRIAAISLSLILVGGFTAIIVYSNRKNKTAPKL